MTARLELDLSLAACQEKSRYHYDYMLAATEAAKAHLESELRKACLMAGNQFFRNDYGIRTAIDSYARAATGLHSAYLSLCDVNEWDDDEAKEHGLVSALKLWVKPQ